MSQKNKKAAGAPGTAPKEAQNLIDSLLDEKTPADADLTGEIAFGSKSPPPPRAASDEYEDEDNFDFQHVPNNRHFDKASSPKIFNEERKVLELDSKEGKHGLRLDSDTAERLRLEPLRSLEATGSHEAQTRLLEEKPQKEKPAQLEDFSESTEMISGKPPAQNNYPDSTRQEPANFASGVSKVDPWMPTEIKSTPFGGPDTKNSRNESKPENRVVHSGFSSAEAALKQSESLRIAQSRISDLEAELERLRRENEQLATAGETLRRRSDELLSKAESLEMQVRESAKILDEEKKVLRGQLQGKDRENSDLRGRIDEMENRLENNFKKIRVRERELEHRLEIIKMESATLVSTKDKMILELKRQIDQLVHETEYGKQKSQELFNQYKEKQETIRRVVRALRIALTILEGDEDAAPLKKVD